MTETINGRFDRLLKAMLAGPAPSARKSASGDQTSGAAPQHVQIVAIEKLFTRTPACRA